MCGWGIFFWPTMLVCAGGWAWRACVSDCDCLARSPYLIGPRKTLSNARRIEQMANAQETAIAVGERRRLHVHARYTPCPGLSLFSLHLHRCLDDFAVVSPPRPLLPCHLERPATDIIIFSNTITQLNTQNQLLTLLSSNLHYSPVAQRKALGF